MSNGKKLLVADASSLILLQKTDLLDLLIHNYSVKICDTVLQEIRAGDESGGEFFRRLQKNKIDLTDSFPLSRKMGRGERDTLLLFFQLQADFVLIDDRKGISYCLNRSIPFINALLIPKILHMISAISQKQCKQTVKQLQCIGYYSDKIVARADKMEPEELVRFFP